MEPEESTLERKRKGSEQSLVPEVEIRDDERVFKSRITVEPILLAIFLADALAASVTSNLVLTRTCEVHFQYNKSLCNKLLGNLNENHSDIEAQVQSYSDVMLMGMNFLSEIVPALMSLFVGPWSDYNGRKLVVVLPSLGYFFKYILMFIFSFFSNLGPEYVLVAVIPVSLSGGMVNFISAVFAYVSDISNQDNQSFRINLVECVIYLASIVGMVSSSYIYTAGGSLGYALIYGICASIVILATVPTHFFVPESVQAIEEGKGLIQVFEVKLLKEMLEVCFKKRKGCRRAVIFLVVATLTISISCGAGESNVTFFYTKLRFGWGVREFTLWAFVSHLTNFLGVVCGTFAFTKWLKVPDAVLGMLSFALKTASSFYVAFVPSQAPRMMFYSGLIGAFGGLCGPVGRTLLSKSVPKEDLGKVFALAGSSESIVPLVVAPLYTFLYNATIKALPNAFLLLSGSLFALCCIFYTIIYSTTKGRNQTAYERMESENQDESEAIADQN